MAAGSALFQPKLVRRADAAIDELVARRAKNPKHVPLGIADKCPSSVARELWFVRDLQNARLSATFARRGNVGISSPHPIEFRVFVGAARIIASLTRGISASPNPAQLARCLACAFSGAIALIRAWRNDVEVRSAPWTILSGGRDVRLFSASASACATSATLRAIELIRPYGAERCGAITTGQVIHSGALA